MIRCPECQNIVDGESRECSNCGYPFDGTEKRFIGEECPECGDLEKKSETLCAEQDCLEWIQDNGKEKKEVEEKNRQKEISIYGQETVSERAQGEENGDIEVGEVDEQVPDAIPEDLPEKEISNGQIQNEISKGEIQEKTEECLAPEKSSAGETVIIQEAPISNIPRKEKNKKKIIAFIGGVLILAIAVTGVYTAYVKYNELSDLCNETEKQLNEEREKNSELTDKLSDVNNQLEESESEIKGLNAKINELENGANKQLTDIKNAYEKQDWQNVILLADALHQKYNGTEEDKKAQEMAKTSQAKLDEAKAAKEAEEAQGYETGITYEQLARTPDDYKGKKVKFYGKVIQIIEGSSTIQVRLAVNDNYDTVLYGEYAKSIVSSRVLENDYITIYGTSSGTISYTSTMGGTITIPGVAISKIDQ